MTAPMTLQRYIWRMASRMSEKTRQCYLSILTMTRRHGRETKKASLSAYMTRKVVLHKHVGRCRM